MNDARQTNPPEAVAPGPSETLKHLAYGEAAVMLIESLMLILIKQRIFQQAPPVAARSRATDLSPS
jgi:hypothetical protein